MYEKHHCNKFSHSEEIDAFLENYGFPKFTHTQKNRKCGDAMVVQEKENLQFDKSALVNSIKHFRNNTNFTKTQKLRVWSGNKEVQIDQWNRMVRNKPAID